MNRPQSSLLAAVVFVALSVSVRSYGAPASSTAEEAKRHFRLGKELYEEGDFRGALNEVQRSFALVPNPKLLYNLGQIHVQLQDYANAIRSFRRYLVEGGDEVTDARRSEILREIDKLFIRVAELTISVNQPGAEISVDEVAVGKSPLPSPLAVNVGQRKVTATLSGYFPATRVVEVVGLDKTNVKLDLQPMAVASSANSSKEAISGLGVATTPPTSLRVPMWLPWTGTGALAVGWAVSGFLAKQSSDDLKKKLGTWGVTSDQLKSARSSTQTRAIVADALGGCTVVAAVASTLFTLTRAGSDSPAQTPSKHALHVDLSPSSVALAGTF